MNSNKEIYTYMYKDLIIEFEKDVNESNVEFEIRRWFVFKNMVSNYNLDELISLSFVHIKKEIYGMVFNSHIENTLYNLKINLYEI
jgi:hypothetical protein